jgi:hypothetical protein
VGGNALDILRFEVMPFGPIEGGQMHVPTRGASEPIICHGEGEDGTQDPVLTTDTPGQPKFRPFGYETLHVGGRDPVDPPGTDGRNDMKPDDDLVAYFR